MKIHEYQAKQLFKQFGLRTTDFELVTDREQIKNAVNKIGTPCVIKAQVHSGARGKNGGVRFCSTLNDAIESANSMLGMIFSSHQLADEIKTINKIIVEKAVNIQKEYYLSITVDRNTKKIAIIFSTFGGMDIEEVAKQHPEDIKKMYINLDEPLDVIPFVDTFNISSVEKFQAVIIIQKLLKLFIEKDCSLIEINPLALTDRRGLVAVDAKINFDDNALFRHQDIAELRDISEENPLEVEAEKHGLSYIKLNGSIGCMVNGAGLAMATIDVIKLANKNAANFLDVGGGANIEKIEHAFKILLSDDSVKAVFINIFGGILRGDVLAQGLKNVAETTNVEIPIIIRLEGTNKEEGAEILKHTNLKFKVVHDLDEAIGAIKELA